MGTVTTLALGSWPRAKECKGVGQEGNPRVTSHAFGSVEECEGMNPHTPKWAPTLGVWIPMESWICRGQNLLDWKVFYIIGKLLERKCLKWACMTHLDTQNTSYGQKKGQESNWQFDSRPLNRPDSLACRWCATYRWKGLNEGYNFALDRISIRGFHTKLWAFKVAGVPTLGILGLALRSPGTKCHLSASSMARHKVYYKGKGGGFPQVRAVVSLLNPNLPVVHLSTKSAPAMH
jgi:hypothetical protein